jgi:hypothetical protein
MAVSYTAMLRHDYGEPDWERIRFAGTMAIYGATIGGCAILVNFLSRASFPEVPEHMSFVASAFFGVVGAIAGGTLTAPIAYWGYGGLPTFAFTARPKRGPRSLLAWGAIGLAYGMVLPMMLGMLVPAAFRFLAFKNGAINVPDLLSSFIDLIIGSPFLAAMLGFQYFFTGIAAGLLFGVGAWIIDIFSSSTDASTAKYGSWVMALGLSIVVVAALVFLPETFLARAGQLR